MKLAIMQPYFVPYLGYWQLLNAVDRFVIYDDVNYIKGGWINRNRILINGQPSYITIPLYQASPNKLICDISMQPSPVWRKKLIKSIENAYRKAPFFTACFPVFEKIINYETECLADYLTHQLRVLATYMSIKTEIVVTSRHYQNNSLTGQDRVLDICKREGATSYLNSQGGQLLYDSETFSNSGIDLRFMVMNSVSYQQRATSFVPSLSIIDALMEVGAVETMRNMNEFELFENPAHATSK